MKAMQVDFTEVNISDDADAADLVVRLNRGYRSVPTIVFPDGSVLTEPPTTTLVAKLTALAN
jgi:mycoredoxin